MKKILLILAALGVAAGTMSAALADPASDLKQFQAHRRLDLRSCGCPFDVEPMGLQIQAAIRCKEGARHFVDGASNHFAQVHQGGDTKMVHDDVGGLGTNDLCSQSMPLQFAFELTHHRSREGRV